MHDKARNMVSHYLVCAQSVTHTSQPTRLLLFEKYWKTAVENKRNTEHEWRKITDEESMPMYTKE